MEALGVYLVCVIQIYLSLINADTTSGQITPTPHTHAASVTTGILFPSTVSLENVTASKADNVCRDTIDTCSHYGHVPCTDATYQAWAKAHCPLYCGFCTPAIVNLGECQDKVPNCAEYNDGLLCTDESYYIWAYENCRGYCHLGHCNNSVCEDDPSFNCAAVDSVLNLCTSNIAKAKLVCRNYCNLCSLVDGEWSMWSAYGSCDVTCNNGTQVRTRTCTNPAPKDGGEDCPGQSRETRPCTQELCPVPGGWSIWSGWGDCSVTCGIGMRRRDRHCSNPFPSRNGDHCFGEGVGYEICMNGSCADGGWSMWEEWGNCSSSGCEVGMRNRERTCTNPTPSPLGKQCLGDAIESELCNGNDSCQSETNMSAFTATYLTNGTTLSSIRFTTILLNEGGDYNSTSGFFTCQFPGFYHFTVSLTKLRGSGIDQISCKLRLNNVNKVIIHVDPHDDSNSDYGSYSASTSATFHLAQNDTVNLGDCSPSSSFDRSASMFSGFLIKEDQ